MINETRERFLRGILERVSAERIVEIHFFPPIRQGQLESGVAVVAVESVPMPVEPPALELAAEGLEEATAALEAEATAVEEHDYDVDAVHREESESATAAELVDAESAVALEEAPSPEPVEPVMAVASRLEVCTASYRWTRKGPERGKWEFDLRTEGDAPLPIVGTVVRGVETRSGEELGAMRLDADGLRELLDSPSWNRPTP